MARARNIKPGIMANEHLAELSPLERLLFIYLWMLADREGRLEDRPKRIKAEALPYEVADVDAMLSRLGEKGFLTRYEVEGERYIQIASFTKHQRPHHNEAASEIPAMEEACTTTGESQDNQGEQDFQPREEALRSDSLIPDLLIPDSLIPDPSAPQPPEGAGAVAPTEKASSPYSAEFEEFWQEYPKRERAASKPDAWKAWKARLKQGVSAQNLITGAINYRKDQVAKGKVGTEFVKLPATFLGKGEHWKAYLGPQPSAPPSGQRSNFTDLPTHTPDMYQEAQDGRSDF
jgi:DNA-binding MarR family transcriptional regulator